MFPFRKKPPTKAEVVKQGVSDAAHALLHAIPTEKIEDKLDDLKKTAAQVALHAAHVAHHAGEVASHKIDDLQHAAGNLSGAVADAASQGGQSAALKSQAAKESALVAAGIAKEALQNRAATLKESAVSLRESLQERASHDTEKVQEVVQNAQTEVKAAQKEIAVPNRFEAAKQTAQEAKERAKSYVKSDVKAKAAATAQVKQAATEKLAAVKDKAAQVETEAEAQAQVQVQAQIEAEKEELKAKAKKIEVPRVDLGSLKNADVKIEYADSSSKWLWILTGIVAGVVLALLFAPTSGRRSRAAIKDRLGKVGDGATDAATAASDKIVDIAHRVEGLSHQVEAKFAADVSSDDDGTIADRVRSVLGHHEVAKTIERINVDCAEGVVTLRGPLLDAPTQETIVAAVKAVPGVKEVISDFLTDEKPADPATYAS